MPSRRSRARRSGPSSPIPVVRESAIGAARTTWTAVRMFIDDQALSWAGAIGLYLFLSVPPFIVAMTYLGSLAAPPEQVEGFIVEQVAKYLPGSQGLLVGIVAHRPQDAATGTISTALLLFSASRAFAALTSAINVLWRRVDALTFWRRQALRVGMILVSCLLLGLAGLAEALLSAAFGSSDGDQVWLLDWQIVPSVLLATFLVIAYKLLPREPVSWIHAGVGAAVATVGVRVTQAGFGILAERGTLETPYGDLAGVALLATWALAIGIIVLFGAALVAALDGKRPLDHEAEERFSRSS